MKKAIAPLFCLALVLVACLFGCRSQSVPPFKSAFSLCNEGHDLERVALVPASCSENGVAAHTLCLRCGELFDLDGDRVSLDALTLPAAHEPDGTWSFHEKGHYQTCKICGEETLAGSHSFENGICVVCGATDKEPSDCSHSGGQATCLEKAICETCGKPYGRLGAHQKVKIASAEYLASEATCTRRAAYHASCSLCGFIYAETFTSGEPLGHEGQATCLSKAVCTRCGETFGSLGEHSFSLETASEATLAAVATCSSGATYYKSCSVCGKVGDTTFSVGDPNTASHEFAADTALSTEDTHTLTCKICGTVDVEAHAGSSSSCLIPVPCTICGRYFVPPDAHRFILENPAPKYLASPATDESPATYYYSCLYCEQPGTNTFVGD